MNVKNGKVILIRSTLILSCLNRLGHSSGHVSSILHSYIVLSKKLRLAKILIPRWTTIFEFSQNCVFHSRLWDTAPARHTPSVSTYTRETARGVVWQPSLSNYLWRSQAFPFHLHWQRVAQWHCSPSDTTTTSAALHGAQCLSFGVTPSIDCCAHPQPGPPLAHWPFGFTFKYSAILSSPILNTLRAG